MTTILTRFKFRRDTAADWTSNNPVLLEGEPALETDTRLVKYGDGSTAWNSLPYAGGAGAEWGDITGTLADQTDLQSALNAKASLSGASFTGNVSTTGNLSASKMAVVPTMRATGVDVTGATGPAAEMYYSGGNAFFTAYDRSLSAYIPTIFSGSTLSFRIGATVRISVAASGLTTISGGLSLSGLTNAADDAAAAAAGVAVNQVYRNGSVLMVRVS